MVGDMLNVERHSASLAANPAAFDGVAADYDIAFTETTLGRILRRRVWRRLEGCFEPGQRVLELACGTGEDACRLAAGGVHVTATDGSVEMVQLAEVKATRAGLADMITTRVLSLQQLTKDNRPFDGPPYDGAFSNFGGVNTIGDWRGLAAGLADLVQPGGFVVLVPMGPICPWEIGWHLAHGQMREAIRRLGRDSTARIGEGRIPVWYPSAGRLRDDFGPWFRTASVESLGLWLPPSYLGRLLSLWPSLWVGLSGLDAASARLARGIGDHYIMILERNDEWR
jgi:SAM-dependent methyltransferase